MHDQLCILILLTAFHVVLSQDITEAPPVVEGGAVSNQGSSGSINETETTLADNTVSSLSNVPLDATADAGAQTGTSASATGSKANADRSTGPFVTVDEANEDNDVLYLDSAVCEACTPDLIIENKCILPHPIDCRKYIQCVKQQKKWTAYNLKCGHGTFWSPEKNTCDQSHLVQCKNDICKNPSVKSYPSNNDNCRAYWNCVRGISEHACCDKHFEYLDGKCVQNTSCTTECPPDRCQETHLKTYANPANCRNYQECREQVSHSMCCPDGFAFKEDKCVVDDSCHMSCPKGSKEVDVAANQTSNATESSCPSVPIGDGSTYASKNSPKTTMSCPADLVYSTKTCVCDYRTDTAEVTPSKTPPTDCKPVLCIDFEKNSNSPIYTTEENLRKPDGRGHWNGNSYIAIPAFSNNDEVFKNIEIQFVFKFSGQGTDSQVLMSNCHTNKDVSTLTPSLAIVLRKKTLGNVNVHYIALSKTDEKVAITHKIEKDQWTKIKIKYDGKRFSASTVPVDYETQERTGEEKYDTKTLQGGIKKGIVPFKIGKCGANDGFEGEMDNVCFQKCKTTI